MSKCPKGLIVSRAMQIWIEQLIVHNYTVVFHIRYTLMLMDVEINPVKRENPNLNYLKKKQQKIMSNTNRNILEIIVIVVAVAMVVRKTMSRTCRTTICSTNCTFKQKNKNRK